MARIILCGYMIRYPVTGMMLVDLHYVLGLKRLGHEVFYLEESGWENSCYNPATGWHGDDPAAGLAAVEKLFREWGLDDVGYCFVRREGRQTWGASWRDVERRLREADLVVNIAGVCWLDEFMLARRRALIDIDPLFSQTGKFGYDILASHELHYTYGTNIGHADCVVPTLGYDWRPLLPPVTPEMWPPVGESGINEAGEVRFTTIANWQAYGGIEFQGERYGQKGEEFERMISLAEDFPGSLELAVDNMPEDDRGRFARHGWNLVDGAEISRTTGAYCAYIRNSTGEFSVAKHAYVKSRSGWFSDRSVCYLASGLPVIVQETGISRHIETGRGILTFKTVEEARDCLEMAVRDYQSHCVAARELVARYFDSKVVLGNLLEEALA